MAFGVGVQHSIQLSYGQRTNAIITYSQTRCNRSIRNVVYSPFRLLIVSITKKSASLNFNSDADSVLSVVFVLSANGLVFCGVPIPALTTAAPKRLPRLRAHRISPPCPCTAVVPADRIPLKTRTMPTASTALKALTLLTPPTDSKKSSPVMKKRYLR